jgi:type IV pilus assembly protein PilB
MGAKDSVVGRLLGNAQKFNHERVVQTIAMLLDHAHSRDASDIHIEPRERFVLVRYRIDGVLRGVHKLPLAAADPLISELKETAHLNAEETNIPQEGQYSTTIDDQIYTVRVATLPVLGGEKVVLRLTPQAARLAPLEALGFWGENLEMVRAALTAPNGLMLVAGSKRVGKTTTLYSLLHILATPLSSIASIEDPIEHRLSGVSQTQVHVRRGIGFAQGLQAALQQDANIIMLSNLADKQVIELAVHAANDGHLLLAGLPADSVSRAILQLQSAGVQPFLLASALRLVIAQRLARQLCPHCRERYQIDGEQRALLDRAFEIQPAAARRQVHELEQQAAREKIGGEGSMNSTPTRITHLWQAHTEGCTACDHTGYHGQVVLTEVLAVRDGLRQVLQQQTTLVDLEKNARAHGFIPLSLDGLVKALRGQTTIEEVLRAIPAR